ncbi:juvenile hormone esterase-like [Lasioglossum baleicum]|uniref:juvenile hormone esterase-like n=1 Tax=Lasioglossum baleicum TaxID=434251 RepID=UPI003FCE82D2
MVRVAVVALVVLLSLTQCLGEETEVVQTTTGPVKGIIKKTSWHDMRYNAFFGIRYAEPPVGDLRFKPPVPIKPWSAVLNADKETPVCPQVDFFTGNYMGVEDCLFINVMSRELGNSTLKPVMVWIYGGAFFAGYTNTSLYGPDFFLEQDVVYVSFNYRVGCLGFLALDHPDAVGNAALKDQVLALKWVQANIAAFGGDPNQVTIFGESAGATSVGLHVLSEQSKGLFKRVIQQSGTPLCQWGFHTPEKAYQNARALAVNLGYDGVGDADLLAFLRSVPIEKMVNMTLQVDYGFLPFRPTIENLDNIKDGSAFLTECPIELYKTGKFTKLPTLMGFNKDEGLFFLNYMVGKDGNHANAIASLLKNSMGTSGPVDLILGSMSGAVFSLAPGPLLKTILDVMNGIMFVAPIDLTQKYIAQANGDNPVYYYKLNYMSQWNIHELVGDSINGTAHVDDIGYLFNVQALNAPEDPEHPFNQFRKKLVTCWTNFAKHGNPTPPNSEGEGPTFGVPWLDSKATGAQFVINEQSAMQPRTLDSMTLSYQDGLKDRLPRETGCKASTSSAPAAPAAPKPSGLLSFLS